MLRSWGIVTLTGSAQPWFGDKCTAAVGLPLGNGIIPVTVTSTTFYRAGDRIVIDPLTASQDLLIIDTVASSTVLNCRSEGGVTHTHLTNAIIVLSIACSEIMIQAIDGNSATVWLGTDNTVTATPGGTAFQQLQKVTAGLAPALFRMTNSVAYNWARTSDGWMIGTASDKVAVTAIVI